MKSKNDDGINAVTMTHRDLAFRSEADRERFGRMKGNVQRRLVRKAMNRPGGVVLERIAACGSVAELVEIEERVAAATWMSEGTRRKVKAAVARRLGDFRVDNAVVALP